MADQVSNQLLASVSALTGGGIALLVCMVSGAIGWIAFKSKVESSVTKEIETHKKQLEETAIYLQAGIQREFLKAQILNPKTVEIYGKLNELLWSAYGAVSPFSGQVRRWDWSDYDADDIQEILEKRGVPNSRVAELVYSLRYEFSSGVEILNEYLDNFERSQALEKTTVARNFCLINAVYISKATMDVALEITLLLSEALNNLEPKNIRAGKLELGEQQTESSRLKLAELLHMIQIELNPK